MSAITYDKIESWLYLTGAVLCVALAIVVLLLWSKLRAAFAEWVDAHTKYSKRHNDEQSVEKDGSAQ